MPIPPPITETPFRYLALCELTPQQIADVMTTAFEGGIGYWCSAARLIEPTVQRAPGEDPWYARAKLYEHPFTIELDAACAEDGKWRLTRSMIGERMAKVPLKRIAEVTSENYDAETCDVLMQYWLFGDIVYG